MGVNVLLTGYERDPVLDRILDPQSVLARLLDRLDLSGTVCLRFIDRYGDAIFNERQCTVIAAELARVLLEEELSDQERSIVYSTLSLAEQCQSEPHQFLRFEGD